SCVAVEEDPIEVENHAPRSIVSMPIARPHGVDIGVPEDLSSERLGGTGHQWPQRSELRKPALEEGRRNSLGSSEQPILAELVTPFGGTALAMVGQPVLVAVDTH